ncbi:hypothetical protein BDP27DRAFT_1371644 [Rhodocollybia butyracea]|uniref:CxC1-like cysteine cluster associated with KDZ transposases domain-containing protein n=1 Tax=Rhodocollybia butyracea TaxID=206335 RepID=A0A9P5P8K2_9AGAR|nr:hypothetical protein BDP27DRAFT_1371644 [Rhodocollybia butyracea]
MKPRQPRNTTGNVIMPTSMLPGKKSQHHCRVLKTVRPSAMRRHRDQTTEEIRVLNIPEIEEEGEQVLLDSMNWDFSQPLSNTGGEMDAQAEGDWEECDEIYHELLNGVRRVLERSFLHWAPQFPGMTDAYMDWAFNEEHGHKMPEAIDGLSSLSLTVFDVFGTSTCQIPLPKDSYISASIPFLKALSNVQGIAFKPYLMQQFSAAYDAYLEVKKRVCLEVDKALGREDPNWRIMHACPCCQYELKEDDAMDVQMLVAMDGNDSLKQVEGKNEAGDDSLAEAADRQSMERFDPRNAGGSYFLSQEDVDRWDEPRWSDILEWNPEGKGRAWTWATTNCDKKWLNTNDTHMGKSWAKFDENGIFLLICRHGIVLSLCDMVKSSKKAKYSLASLYHFLEAERLHRKTNGKTGPPSGQMSWRMGRYPNSGSHDQTLWHLPFVTQAFFIADKRLLSMLITLINLKLMPTSAAGITDAKVFFDWLQEEKEYLQGLAKEPPQETLQMEYHRKLVALKDCQRAQQHTQENERKLLADVQALETKLDIRMRWTEGSEEWNRAAELTHNSQYRQALDKLEGLLVAHIFELSKMNVSGTGYKMRKHLAHALKRRSKTIQAALKDYNTVAAKMKPLVDVREKVWASPANCVLMTQFFKFVGAEMELHRVHQEICQFLTHMQDESDELCAKENELKASNPTLALQIKKLCMEHGRFKSIHYKRLHSITLLRGFDGKTNSKYFTQGTSVKHKTSVPASFDQQDKEEVEPGDQEDESESEVKDDLIHCVDTLLQWAGGGTMSGSKCYVYIADINRSIGSIYIEECAGRTRVKMFYKNFEDHITWKTGIIVWNWPFPVFRSPSELASMAELDILQNAWTMGTAHFYMMTLSEFRWWQVEQQVKQQEGTAHGSRAEGEHPAVPHSPCPSGDDGSSGNGTVLQGSHSQPTHSTSDTHSCPTPDSRARQGAVTFVNSFSVMGAHGTSVTTIKRTGKERSDKGKP